MTEVTTARVAFLDTNTLHYIRLYLSFAKAQNLNPFSDSHEIHDIIEGLSDGKLVESLKCGMEIVRYLSGENRISHVEYAVVSEIELLSGMARGKAIMKMADESPPHRKWNRIQESEIRDRLCSSDLNAVRSSVDEFTLLLEESAIAVRSDHGDRNSAVLELAKDVSSLVYMEPMDGVIYASALIAQADFLFTSDGYFKNTVNKIHQCSTDRYREINQRLREHINQIALWPNDQVVIASAHRMKSNGNWAPTLNL